MGVRRYQNEDGSLTPEGLIRYRKLYNDSNALADKARAHGNKADERKYRSISRGAKALLNNKDNDKELTKTGLKVGAGIGAALALGSTTTSNILQQVGTATIVSNGWKTPIYAIAGTTTSAVAAPYVMPAVLAASAGVTAASLYKVIRRRRHK